MSGGDSGDSADEVRRRAGGRAWVVGAAVGLGTGVFSTAGMATGAFCCPIALLGVVAPILAALVAGPIAAAQPVYEALAPGGGIRVGAGLGARAGAAAAAGTIFAPVLVSSLGVGVLGLRGSLVGGQLGTVLAVLGMWIALNLAVAVVAVGFGAAAGALTGEFRQPLVSREPGGPTHRAPPTRG